MHAATESGRDLLYEVPVTSRSEVKEKIDTLDKGFDRLKDSTRECLEKRKILVKKVADALTSLLPDDDEHHKIFVESRVEKLYASTSNDVLFGHMNGHWNYLDPTLLDHLVTKLDLGEVKGEMEVYKSDLQQFRATTPLTLFCRTQRRRRIKPPGEFREMIAEFDWPQNVTLEVVEQFRQEYASHYNLHECAMMIYSIRCGSFIVTWLIPESLVELLRAKVPKHILEKYLVITLTIAGIIVYKKEVSNFKIF